MIVASQRFGFSPGAWIAATGGSKVGGFNINDFVTGWGTIAGGSILDFYKVKRSAQIAERYGYQPGFDQSLTGSIDRYLPLLMIGLLGIAAVSFMRK